MADTGYTPTTDEVSSAYCVMKADEAKDQSKANRILVAVFSVLEFNRWMIARDRKVADEAWKHGYDACANGKQRHSPHSADPSKRPTWTTAPGHYDGDGCTFPAPGHLIPIS